MSKPMKSIFDFFKKEEEVKVTFAEITTIDGVVMQYDGDLAEGSAVFVLDAEGNQIPAPEGQYQVELEGIKIVNVDVNGVVTAIEDVAVEEEPMAEEMMSKVEFSAMTEKIINDIDERFKALESKFNELATAKESKFKDERKKVETSKEAMSVSEILNQVKNK
jgi:hypothetical protein